MWFCWLDLLWLVCACMFVVACHIDALPRGKPTRQTNLPGFRFRLDLIWNYKYKG